MSDNGYKNSFVRRAADASPVNRGSLNPADVYHAVLTQHGADAARKTRISLEFLNGGPIDTTDTTDARQRRETGK